MSEPLRAFSPDSGDRAPRTIGDVIALYLNHGRDPRGCARAWTEGERLLRRFEAAPSPLGQVPIGQLELTAAKAFHLRFWIDREEAWRSEWTKKRVIGRVKRAFNWALKLGVIDRNPFAAVTGIAGPRRRPMTDDEYQALIRHTDATFRPTLVFLRYTGARPSEMASARWTDLSIDLDAGQGCITLHEHKTAHSQRQPRPRVIVLHPAAIRLLIWLKRRQFLPDESFIFSDARGHPWTRNALSLRMQRLRRRAGVPLDAKLYGLRHAFATSAIVRGVDLKTLAELLGHTTTRMTEHYLHLASQRQHLSDAAKRVFE